MTFRKCSSCGQTFECNEQYMTCSDGDSASTCVCGVCLPPSEFRDYTWWSLCFADEDEILITLLTTDIRMVNGKFARNRK